MGRGSRISDPSRSAARESTQRPSCCGVRRQEGRRSSFGGADEPRTVNAFWPRPLSETCASRNPSRRDLFDVFRPSRRWTFPRIRSPRVCRAFARCASHPLRVSQPRVPAFARRTPDRNGCSFLPKGIPVKRPPESRRLVSSPDKFLVMIGAAFTVDEQLRGGGTHGARANCRSSFW